MLELRQVVKDFGGLRAVDRCSFAVCQGTITALIGPNGAGKTTLFNLITGFLKPDGGSIWFQGRRIDGQPSHKIVRLGILRTFQVPRELEAMTVLENLLLVPAGQTGERPWAVWLLPRRVAREEQALRRQAGQVLEFLGLVHLADAPAGSLSTGQKKLLELGRTLMASPSLVLLDEPGAGVNPTLMNLLAGHIRSLCRERGITFLIIAHDMELVMRLCDPIVVLDHGSVIAQGAPDEVRHNPEVVRAYLGGPV
ncbi:MAG: ABC transporter ATP-binding protein [SAR202 cluster bacterium]|nr:ABC transporter ATP-binding protein [SAR202 cluster bacterium]